MCDIYDNSYATSISIIICGAHAKNTLTASATQISESLPTVAVDVDTASVTRSRTALSQ